MAGLTKNQREEVAEIFANSGLDLSRDIAALKISLNEINAGTGDKKDGVAKLTQITDKLVNLLAGDEQFGEPGLISRVKDLEKFVRATKIERAKLIGIGIGASTVVTALMRLIWK